MKDIVVNRVNIKEPVKSPQRFNYSDSFLSKVSAIIVSDLKSFIFRKKIVVDDAPVGWDDYKRFCELARGKR